MRIPLLLGLVVPFLTLGISSAAAAAPLTMAKGDRTAAIAEFVKKYGPELAKSPERRAELDALCRQRDCDASQLFWYTDLEEAKAAAQASGKPILSLRLLGHLDQDLSCANSRFFRVALYPNAQIAPVLRDRFVLHWQSVRPAPKVTVDFGDGRKLERTLTGNSIHYILSPEGRPIEALPGLYGPGAFLKQLQQAEKAVAAYEATPVDQRDTFLQQYHRDRLTALQNQWTADLKALGLKPPQLDSLEPDLRAGRNPDAIAAGRIAMTKAVVESPLVLSVLSAAGRNRTALAEVTDQAAWEKLAQRSAPDAVLDTNSRKLMQRKKGVKTAAELQPALRSFEKSIALDTVRNEYLLHSQLHAWFLSNTFGTTQSVDSLNARVYRELFLTPDADPWLGLVSPESFSAIDRDGLLP